MWAGSACFVLGHYFSSGLDFNLNFDVFGLLLNCFLNGSGFIPDTRGLLNGIPYNIFSKHSIFFESSVMHGSPLHNPRIDVQEKKYIILSC